MTSEEPYPSGRRLAAVRACWEAFADPSEEKLVLPYRPRPDDPHVCVLFKEIHGGWHLARYSRRWRGDDWVWAAVVSRRESIGEHLKTISQLFAELYPRFSAAGEEP